mgnify:CR=1 FL=1
MKFTLIWIVALQMAGSGLSPRLHAQIVSSGLPLPNSNWQVLLTPSGYLDLIIDARTGFEGREYLSGEWASAISYSGHDPMWLPKQLIFPDWLTNSNFEVIMKDGQSIWIKDPNNPLNADGNLIMQSMLRNDHLEITHEYQIWNVPDGVAQGLSPQGNEVPAQAMLLSDGFAYQHTLTFYNTSDEPLTDVHFFHLLHSLHGNRAIYDDTDHGGAMADYRFDFTQQGLSHSFHNANGGLYAHTDYITAHSRVAPDAFSNGYYGIQGIDVHDVGKPSTGVHLDIESNTFTEVAEFEPEEGGWVASTARYPLGTIPVGESKSFSLLFSLRTMSKLIQLDPGIVVETPTIEGDTLIIRIKDTNDLFGNTGLGFSVESSPNMRQDTWTPLPLPFRFNLANPGKYFFEVPYDPTVPKLLYRIRLGFGF